MGWSSPTICLLGLEDRTDNPSGILTTHVSLLQQLYHSEFRLLLLQRIDISPHFPNFLSLTLLIKRARWPLLLHQFTNSALGAWWWQKPPQCLKELINLLVLHMCRWSVSKNLRFYMNADHKMLKSLRSGATTKTLVWHLVMAAMWVTGGSCSFSVIAPMRCTTPSEKLEPPTLGGWKLMHERYSLVG